MNFKKILANLKYYLIIGGFLFGFIVLWAGLPGRNRGINIYFLITGFLMLLPMGILYLREKTSLKKAEKKYKRELTQLKKRGEKIEVDLENVKIKSSKWNEIVITDNTQYAGLNELVGRSDRNTKSVERNLNHVTINIPYKGKTIRYKANISMDTDTLKIHFAIQKKTILYVDPFNKRNMYLDLEFLE